MSTPVDDIERAARLCDRSAAVYLAYSEQPHRPEEERRQFRRDWETCSDLARRIRALRDPA